MTQSFNPFSYINKIGYQLIHAFENASQATTPGLIGGAREHPVRQKLEHLLPVGIGVGSGCVIDSFGGTSMQQDVVLYEKAFCPIFSVNGMPEATYYPCEGVIAVGEVKSAVDSKELVNIFDKIRSVKILKRFTRKSASSLGETACFRNYGNNGGVVGTPEQGFNQTEKPFDQIFGFAIAGSLKLKADTFCAKFAELASSTDDYLSPNLLVLLNNGVVFPIKIDTQAYIQLSQKDATGFYFVDKKEENFQFLLTRLYEVYREGRTVECSAFARYITCDGVLKANLNGKYIPLSKN